MNNKYGHMYYNHFNKHYNRNNKVKKELINQ